ncbi:MAG: hypothetical protein KDC67_14395, partial [Ignavibacteriae bacterium]|nr:hypothetical protein [Ignavibacteriota bacterium]
MDDYVGQWDKSRQQIPSEFKNERVLNDIKVVLPIPPTINKIVGFDKPKKEQRWVLPHIPSDKEIASMPSEERKKLIQRELDRRINGYFFYNAGGIEYITGIHYFYLTYWRIMGTGLPDFRDSDRDFFYIWDSIVKDKDCFGLLYFTGRRDGKTEKALNILYEYTSLEEEVNSGIQSQTTPDAKQIFTRLIHSWKKMPYFWKPTDSGESNPK